MTKLVTMLPEDCSFFIVTGSDTAKVVRPVAQATPATQPVLKSVLTQGSSG